MFTDLLSIPQDDFWRSAIMVICIVVVAQLFLDLCEAARQIIYARRVRTHALKSITLNLINYLHCQSADFINKKMLGKLSQQTNNIATSSVTVMRLFFARIIPSFITMIVGLGIVASLHWSIAAIILGLIVIRFSWLGINFKKIILTNTKTAASISQIHGATTDTLGGSANVRAFSGRIKELKILRYILDKYKIRYINHLFAERKFWLPASMLGTLSFGAVMFLCAFYFQSGVMDLGQAVFTIGAYSAINSSMWEFMDVLPEMFEVETEAAQNYKELIGKISVKDIDNAPALSTTNGVIDFEKVNFRYDKKSPWVLRNFSLHIAGGEHVGIVGLSGSGKTTIIKLLMRLYDIQSGEIKIDGQDIADVSLNSLRKNIALIPQDTALFNRTILENLRYARDKASMSEIRQAAMLAGANDFIMAQAEGYDTIVGDRGVKLSGGQRQRIAIARAFLQRASILLVDEATSALDSETEEIIQCSLEKISRGKTTLVIAHRLSTLSRMNRIIVLDKGRIVESGTHAELLRKRGGKYAKMWKNQTDGFMG
jgi:ATP-binding cassette subfamily B protein